MILTAGWVWADWPDLAARRLPDPDDLMRMVQIRDWLQGQNWRDLTQHRLGPAGVPMHWSRLGDLGPAAIIVALAPLTGMAAAEVTAVIAWPALLFLLFLLLSASITTRIGDARAAPVAVIVAALAWPGTWVFMPGRIDHHGLQIVLLLLALDTVLRRPSRGAGAALGLATAASLTLGVETAPLLAVLMAGAVLLWLRAPEAERVRLGFAGLGLVGGTALAAIGHPREWSPLLCDAFTPQSAWAMGLGGAALVVLAILPRALGSRGRVGACLLAALLVCVGLMRLSPACLTDPYAAVPPELRRLWLDQVEEARNVFSVGPGVALAYLGLGVAGLFGSVANAVRAGDPRRWLVAALSAVALLIAVLQLRGAHLAAALAAPALAQLVLRARQGGGWRRVPAWLASLGIVYGLAGQIVAGAPVSGRAGPACHVEAGVMALRALPAGMVLAPIDLGPLILAETGQHVLAGPYHRNIAGNLAALRWQSGTDLQARAAGADYRLDCSGVKRVGRQPQD